MYSWLLPVIVTGVVHHNERETLIPIFSQVDLTTLREIAAYVPVEYAPILKKNCCVHGDLESCSKLLSAFSSSMFEDAMLQDLNVTLSEPLSASQIESVELRGGSLRYVNHIVDEINIRFPRTSAYLEAEMTRGVWSHHGFDELERDLLFELESINPNIAAVSESAALRYETEVALTANYDYFFRLVRSLPELADAIDFWPRYLASFHRVRWANVSVNFVYRAAQWLNLKIACLSLSTEMRDELTPSQYENLYASKDELAMLHDQVHAMCAGDLKTFLNFPIRGHWHFYGQITPVVQQLKYIISAAKN